MEDTDVSKVETVEKRDQEKEETGMSDGNKEDNNTENRDSDGTVDINDQGPENSDICKIDIDKDLSKDEFDSDLVIDEGKCDTNGEKVKRVSFNLNTDERESVKSSRDPNLDSDQETLMESIQSSKDPILDSSQETLQSYVTQMMTDDTELTVTFTEDTQDDDDYPPLSQNMHRPW